LMLSARVDAMERPGPVSRSGWKNVRIEAEWQYVPAG
jgi:hypothetical protein